MKLNISTKLIALLMAIYSNSSTAQDHVTQYEYDARGRLISVNDDNGNNVYYSLDEAGNRKSVSESQDPIPDQTPPVITRFLGPTGEVPRGSSITLSWSSSYTTHCNIVWFSNNTLENLSSSGKATVRIFEDTGFTLTCYDGNESDSLGIIVRIENGGNTM